MPPDPGVSGVSMKWTSRRAPAPGPAVALPLLGATLGLLGLWRGGAGALDGGVAGRGWAEALGMASFVARGVWGLYDPRASLLHASAVVTLGEALGSYANAATLLSSGGLLIGLFAALSLATRLGGPLAALLVGGSLFAGAPLVDAAHFTGPEPLAGGLLLAVVALLGACLERPRPAIAAAAGLCAALALALDLRAALLLPFGLAALLAPPRGPARPLFSALAEVLAALRERRQSALLRRLHAGRGTPDDSPKRPMAARLQGVGRRLGPALLGLMGGGLLLQALPKGPPVEGLFATARLLSLPTLRADLLRLDDPRLHAACERLASEDFLRPGFLLEPCAVALARQNLGHLLPPFVSGGGVSVFVGLVLCLLLPRPTLARRGGPLLWSLGLGLPMLVGAMLQPWSAGALALYAPFACLLLPIGLGRLHHRLGLGLAPATLVSFALIGLFWGPLRAGPRADPLEAAPEPQGRVARVVAALQPGGQYLDCSGQGLNFAWLPARVEEAPPLPLAGLPLDLRTQDHCQRWMTEPPSGPALVSVTPRSDDLPNLPALLRGWNRLYEEPGWALYGR